MKHALPVIPANWPFEHIPTWELDKDGELEVDNLTCRTCEHHGKQCKCIDHDHVHFFRPYFSCDVGTADHTICRAYKPSKTLYPAGYIAWEFLGGFDEWQRLWRKQWHPRRDHDYSPQVCLIRAHTTDDRSFSDDRYIVSYDDFVNCRIMQPDGIHCLNYIHIERTRDQRFVTGYKWVYEGPGIWRPWNDNTYLKEYPDYISDSAGHIID